MSLIKNEALKIELQEGLEELFKREIVAAEKRISEKYWGGQIWLFLVAIGVGFGCRFKYWYITLLVLILSEFWYNAGFGLGEGTGNLYGFKYGKYEAYKDYRSTITQITKDSLKQERL